MNENTVFQNPQGINPQSPPYSTEIPPPASPSVPPPPPESSLFSRGTLIKGALGLIFLLIFSFLIFSVIGPRFFKQKPEKITLTYWGLWEDSRVMQAVFADFERENPNISVQYVKEDIKQYRNRLLTRIKNGTGADVFRFHNSWVPQLFDVLLPLSSDVISADAFRKQFYPVAQTDLIKNGAIYGIPLEIDTLSLFINTELFQAASLETPTTWEDFAKSARVLTVKDETGRIKTSGAALGTFDNITHAPDIVSLLFVQNGADIKNLLKTDQASSDALSFYASFASGEGNVWDQTLDPSILAFAKGNLAMYFGYSWDVFTIKAINPNLSFQIASVPHLPGRNMTIASYWAEGVSSKSKHQKEALLFMKFLAKKETQQKLFTEISKTRLFGEPYANKELKDLLKDNQFVYPFVSQADGAVSSFFSSDTFDDGLNSQMNAYLGNAVRSILGNTSPQSAVETLSSGVSQVLQQYEGTPQK
ncbi:MAG: sugar ABC transporter substrate-binding protein [Candidatus Levybacteria bacterium]|nr:sugar ABC transporter substrate-binding protein [Candidatus Levybacteria bacterium]MBI3070030.1 sugar ABC transporter substrate-binding protein [Candidatus Levybacteria bacterium]